MLDSSRFCLVTGAAGGIGRALVKEFCDDGYIVIGMDIGEQPKDLACHYWIVCDLNLLVNDEEFGLAMIQKVADIVEGTGIHALINNAAIQVVDTVEGLTRKKWCDTLNVNVLAPFLLTQGLLGALEKVNGGVINIGSIHSHLTKKGFVAYATSKAALAGITRSMAVELGSRVRINAIEPAAIQTDMLTSGFSSNPSGMALLVNCHPIGRIGDPEDVARLAVFLCSDYARFIHGATIAIDGGISSRLFDPI